MKSEPVEKKIGVEDLDPDLAGKMIGAVSPSDATSVNMVEEGGDGIDVAELDAYVAYIKKLLKELKNQVNNDTFRFKYYGRIWGGNLDPGGAPYIARIYEESSVNSTMRGTRPTFYKFNDCDPTGNVSHHITGLTSASIKKMVTMEAQIGLEPSPDGITPWVGVIPIPDQMLTEDTYQFRDINYFLDFAGVPLLPKNGGGTDGALDCDVRFIDENGTDVVLECSSPTTLDYTMTHDAFFGRSISQITHGQITDLGNCLVARNFSTSHALIYITLKRYEERASDGDEGLSPLG